MLDLKQIRPMQGMETPLTVRMELRQNLARWLTHWRHTGQSPRQEGDIDGDALLRLCLHYRVEYPGAVQALGPEWDAALDSSLGEPTFPQLNASGWVFFDGIRWLMLRPPLGLARYVSYPSERLKIFLLGLVQARLVHKGSAPPADIQALLERAKAHLLNEQGRPSEDTHWAAKRLWERLLSPTSTDTGTPSKLHAARANFLPTAAQEESTAKPPALTTHASDLVFQEWCDWCTVLNISGIWDPSWGDAQRFECREAAYRVLAKQNIWDNWELDAPRYLTVIDDAFKIPAEHRRFSNNLPAMPTTLVAKLDWLKNRSVEAVYMERLETHSTSFAFNVLLSELRETDISSSVLDSSARLMQFVCEHPMALESLLLTMQATPKLLADLLIQPKTVCIAARLIFEWQQPPGIDRWRCEERDAQTKFFAEQDALSMLAHHISQDAVSLEEVAALITWCYSSGLAIARSNSERMCSIGKQVLTIVSERPAEVQTALLQRLVEQAPRNLHVKFALFRAVLEGLDLLQSAAPETAAPIVSLYSTFARELQLDRTDVASLSPDLAACLIRLALNGSAEACTEILMPFDIRAWLDAAASEEREFTRTAIAHTLRQHVRLIARAVAGWSDNPIPSELSDALQTLVSRTSIEHAERDRIGALTDRFTAMRFLGREQGSPAEDITAAWSRLDETNRQALLRSLEETDDPVLLANLCRHLPTAAKAGIQSRLARLTPDNAAMAWTWTELENRVSALMSAEEYGLARQYLDRDKDMEVERAPAAYRLARFELELQLLIKEQDWTNLDAITVPATWNEIERKQGTEKLEFYQATSQLLRPDGRVTAASAKLQRLASRSGAPSAYIENAFAAAIRELLGESAEPLVGEPKQRGLQLLAKIQSVFETWTPSEQSSNTSTLVNRALLLTALSRPGDAFESLAVARVRHRSPGLELSAALSKRAMGYSTEALAILDAAIVEFGEDEQLVATRADIQAGLSPSTIASTSLAVEAGRSAREAILGLKLMLPIQVGDVLGPPGGSLRGYLLREVSRAVASLQHMAPVLRHRTASLNDAKYEDDLNTMVRELLNASFSIPGWHAADQSLGGSTVNGNPGRRDAVICAAGQEVSIYEALVVSGLNSTTIKAHFDKLITYGTVDMYFHVTYSYAPDIAVLLQYLRKMAECDPPAGLVFKDCVEVSPPNYETSGYVVTYALGHRDVAIAFLVADLRQPATCAAATPIGIA